MFRQDATDPADTDPVGGGTHESQAEYKDDLVEDLAEEIHDRQVRENRDRFESNRARTTLPASFRPNFEMGLPMAEGHAPHVRSQVEAFEDAHNRLPTYDEIRDEPYDTRGDKGRGYYSNPGR